MTWDGKLGRLKCESCGHTVDAPVPQGTAVVEHDLAEGLAAGKVRGRLGAGTKQVKCSECGAMVEFADGITATKCSFCGSPSVLVNEARRDLLQPESVLPFAVDKPQALASFKKWLGGLWFRPSDLSDGASVSEVRGVYVPYWTFDARVHTQWSAERGWAYNAEESYVDANQNTQVRTVRKIRWEPASGWRDDAYDDQLVCASKGLPEDLARRVSKFDTKKLVPFTPEVLAGFSAESYAIDLAAAWTTAQADIGREQERRAKRDIGGDEQRNLVASHGFSGVTFKHTLLPVWIAAFRYHGDVFRFLVNGQTGEVSGKAPVSWTKILLFVAVLVGIIVLLVVLLGRRH
jgi:hypothetical protein